MSYPLHCARPLPSQITCLRLSWCMSRRFGWSVGVPAGPLTRPLNFTKEILETSRIPAGAECSLLKERLDALGLNGLLEIADWENWHLIGQLAISHARRKGVSDKAAFTNIVNIAAAAFNAIRDEGAYSIWHGSLWYAVAQPGGIDYSWTYLMSNICTKTKEYMPYSFYGSCFHGIAHGVLYHYTQPPFDECSVLDTVNTSKVTAIDQVYAYCDSAPNMGLKQACFSGMFHALSETELEPYPNSWSFPCDRCATRTRRAPMPPLRVLLSASAARASGAVSGVAAGIPLDLPGASSGSSSLQSLTCRPLASSTPRVFSVDRSCSPREAGPVGAYRRRP